MIYALWAVVFFFSASWTLGLIINPSMRVKSTIVTIIYWWISIGFALVSAFNPWHLLWLMPLALIAPMLFMQAEMASSFRTSVTSIFFKSLFVLGPALGALIYLSQ
ncbi:hypothetical protein N7333_01755 [Pseudomonas sp. GD04158]|uniref:hypothetical protein n=1 Tax=Pseudomonas sp. GD04158 TaxID=2975439 RepID=UPI0024499742|nr:hypothetical protein [Pseudomonas sp. GD04158]MDH0095300.1 hypothetical protein [Pseudomonas sp. GD04158]